MLPVSDFDGPWKEALDAYLPDIVAFFFPSIGAEIDWSRGYEPLDKELQQVAPLGDTGGQAVDKLIQVALVDGAAAWVLIHLEVQSQADRLFAERMFRYHARLFDHYRRQIVSLAILGDDRANWRPASFSYERWGCALDLTFPIAKLLDYAIDALEADPNPCATVVLAHLTAQATRRDPERRARAKVDLARRLYRLGYDRERIVQLFRFIEWLLRLPPELEDRTWREIRAFEEAEQMTYITYGERIGLERGRVEGLQEAIVFGLELKFGDAGAKLLPAIREITDLTTLHEIMAQLKTATTLEDVRAVYRARD
ncbi:MAG TPA: hypothetical protein VIL85_25620 [Thermomicrobiales bacterium]|jgi:hypothetical protein